MKVLLPTPPHRQPRPAVLTPWIALGFTWTIWAPLPPLCVVTVVVAIVHSVYAGTLVWFCGVTTIALGNLAYMAMTFSAMWLGLTPWERIQLRHGRIPPGD